MKKTLLTIMLAFIAIPAFAGYQEQPISQPYLYSFSSGTTVKVVKSLPGILHTLTVTGGTTSVIDIYDGTLSSSTSLAQIASFTTTNALQTYTFDVGFSSGCTVQTTNTALKYTVSYL